MFPRSFGCLFVSLAAEMWGCFNTSHLVKLSVDLEVFFEKPEVGFGSEVTISGKSQTLACICFIVRSDRPVNLEIYPHFLAFRQKF